MAVELRSDDSTDVLGESTGSAKDRNPMVTEKDADRTAAVTSPANDGGEMPRRPSPVDHIDIETSGKTPPHATPGSSARRADARDPHSPFVVTRKHLIALMLVIMNESISVSLLFPFIGLLVVRLSPGMSKADAGKLSGLVIGAFQITQAACTGTWGRFSDEYGRRPLIVLGLMGSTVLSLCFGMSSTVWQLMLFRGLYGMANGNAPLIKTMVPELSTGETEAGQWAMMSAGWAIGSTIGPTFGGLLYDPAASMPAFAGTVFESHPALLPAMAASCYSVFSIVVTVLLLPESNRRAKPMPGRLAAFSHFLGITADPEDAHHDPNSAATHHEAPAPFGVKEFLQHPLLRRVLLVYVMLCWVNTSYNETFPLLSILPVSEGGFGLDASVIGIIFTGFALQCMAATSIFSKLTTRFGRLALLRWSLIVCAVCIAFTPVLATLFGGTSKVAIVIACCVYVSFRTMPITMAFSVATMGIGAIAPREHLGIVTGLSHSCGNLARAIVPPFFTYLFALSANFGAETLPTHDGQVLNHTAVTTVQHVAAGSLTTPSSSSSSSSSSEASVGLIGHGFPFNRWLVFLLMGAGCVCALLFTRGLQEKTHFTRPDAAHPGKGAAVDHDDGHSDDEMFGPSWVEVRVHSDSDALIAPSTKV